MGEVIPLTGGDEAAVASEKMSGDAAKDDIGKCQQESALASTESAPAAEATE